MPAHIKVGYHRVVEIGACVVRRIRRYAVQVFRAVVIAHRNRLVGRNNQRVFSQGRFVKFQILDHRAVQEPRAARTFGFLDVGDDTAVRADQRGHARRALAADIDNFRIQNVRNQRTVITVDINFRLVKTAQFVRLVAIRQIA